MKYSETKGVDELVDIIEHARSMLYNREIFDNYPSFTQRDRKLIELVEKIIFDGQQLLAIIEPTELNINNAKTQDCYCTQYTCRCG